MSGPAASLQPGGAAVEIIWGDELTAYDHGPGHPLRPVRLELTMALARQLGVLDRPGISFRPPSMAGDDLLGLVHDPMYIGYVKKISREQLVTAMGRHFGFGNADNPV